jgi:tryptophan 7-halogenase
MIEAHKVRKVVIIGRDDALWLSANVLWRAFNAAGLDITVVELPSLLRAGDVYPTLKQQEAYHQLIGIDEKPMMRATQATYSLGQRFANFSKNRPPFIHAYSTYGRGLNRVSFHHYWVKARAAGLKADFDDFSINAAAAKNGRFFIPGEAVDGFAICDYGYHLDAAAYCQVLKTVALQRKIKHVTARLADVVKDAEDGRIVALKLMNGETVEGDFFIDATGSESALLGQALGVKFDSWRKWLPCDRLLTTHAPAMSPLPSFSQIAAFRSGWVGMFPLRNKTAIQQVYTSIDLKDEEAYEAAGIVSAMRLHPDAVVTPFSAGTRSIYWEKNCVAIGEAAVVLDPIDSVRMHSNLIGLSHLISLFPVDSNCMLESVEYNRNVASAFERIRDYQMCHYLLNQRYDQPFWDFCRRLEAPDQLRYKLDLFAARGNLAQYDDETFEDDDWYSMLLGHGLVPKAYDPLADQVPEAEIIQQFQRMLSFINMNVKDMKPMEAFLGVAVPG